MKKLSVQKLTLCGVMAALVFVMTYFPKIPVPVTGGYVHLGDGAIFLSVLLLGPLGIPAAAVGSMLSDLIGGYIDRKSTRLNSSHVALSRMPSSA